MPQFVLVLLRSAFEQVITELQLGIGRFAYAPLTQNYVNGTCQLIAAQAPELLGDCIDGQSRSSVDSWMLVESVSKSEFSQPLDVAAKSQLRSGQVFCFLQVGLDGDLSNWRCVVSQGDQVSALGQIHLIGGGMHVLDRQPNQIEDVQRVNGDEWSRLVGVIGEEALKKMHNSSVLLFGAGKIGSLMAMTLVMHGIRRLTIVDFDHLEAHNLFGTFGASHADLDQPKAEVLARFLHQLRPDCLIHAMVCSVNHPDVIRMARSADLIIDCVDTDTPRIAASQLCNRLLIPNLSLGTIVRKRDTEQSIEDSGLSYLPDQLEMGVDVKMLLPGTCHVCSGGITNELDAIAELNTSPQSDRHYLSANWNESGRVGSLVSLNQIAVGVGLQMWLDLLADRLELSFFLRIAFSRNDGIVAASTMVIGSLDCKYCGALQLRNKHVSEDVVRFRQLQTLLNER